MGHRFQLDVTKWPVAVFYSEEIEGDAPPSVDELIALVDQVLAHERLFISIHDLSNMPMVGSTERSAFVSAVNARSEALSRYMCAHAAIATGPLQRGLVTAVLWFIDLPFTTRVFTRREEAETWLREEYDARLGAA